MNEYTHRQWMNEIYSFFRNPNFFSSLELKWKNMTVTQSLVSQKFIVEFEPLFPMLSRELGSSIEEFKRWLLQLLQWVGHRNVVSSTFTSLCPYIKIDFDQCGCTKWGYVCVLWVVCLWNVNSTNEGWTEHFCFDIVHVLIWVSLNRMSIDVSFDHSEEG